MSIITCPWCARALAGEGQLQQSADILNAGKKICILAGRGAIVRNIARDTIRELV